MKSIVVIPTYNEADNIKSLIYKLNEVVPDTHILVVDDNSPDKTATIVEEMQKNDTRIHLIVRAGKMGLGTAYCAGFKWALSQGYDAICEMDADFSHDPNELNTFFREFPDYDLIIGSRYIKGVNVINWPLSRLLLSYGANIYTKIITGMPINDATGGFKCFRANKLREIDLDTIKSNGYGFQIEMNFRMWKKGARIKEVPIIFIDRRNGVSKMNKSIIYEAVFMVWKLKFFPWLLNKKKK